MSRSADGKGSNQSWGFFKGSRGMATTPGEGKKGHPNAGDYLLAIEHSLAA
jgi:hypothetical protein